MENIENLGLYLKQVREERKIPVAQIAQALKTKTETIQALEANDFGKIPAPTYVKGYLRSYANYLGIEGDPLLMEYNRQYPQAKQPLVAPEHKIPRVGISMSVLLKSKLFISIILAIIAIPILIVVLVYSMHKKSAKKAPVKEVPVQIQQPQVQTQKEPEKIPAVSPIKTPVATPMSLSAKALDNVWVRISSDTKVIFEGVLQKNDKENWQAQNEFKLRIGNPSKLSLTLNDQPVGNISPYGPINVVINKDGVKVEK